MQDYKIYSAGEFITTKTSLDVVEPFSKKIIATTYLAEKKELDHCIEKGLAVKEDLKNLPSFKRYEILSAIANGIKNKREHLATVLSRESGKPMRYALSEIDRAAQTFIIAAEESKRLPKEYISLDWTPQGKGREGIINYFPVGLIAGIAPFNFPMNLAVHKIAPAIAAGCPIILKPASSTPLSTLELSKIIDATDLPKGAVSILPMNRIAGNQLVTDDRFKLLSFTGSPEVGWKMKQQAGNKKVVLELGGNAAVIVTESANLNDAIPKSVSGGFAYSGQICIHAQRFFVQDTIFEKFTTQFIEKTQKLNYGDPLDEKTEISSMIDEENAIRVENWILEAIEKGAKLLTGGKRRGNYVEPTILTNTNNTMNVCSEEIFGPVVIIERYKDIGNAIEFVNDSTFGLQAGIFSNNHSEIDYVFNHLEVGGVILNDVPTFRVDHMPYGGIKNSGLGREGVKYAILDMMEPRILVK